MSLFICQSHLSNANRVLERNTLFPVYTSLMHTPHRYMGNFTLAITYYVSFFKYDQDKKGEKQRILISKFCAVTLPKIVYLTMQRTVCLFSYNENFDGTHDMCMVK